MSEEKAEYKTYLPSSAYEAVLPLLLDRLSVKQSRDDLQKALDVRKVQLDDWLKQAVQEGHIVKEGRPVKYRLARLFHEESTASVYLTPHQGLASEPDFDVSRHALIRIPSPSP